MTFWKYLVKTFTLWEALFFSIINGIMIVSALATMKSDSYWNPVIVAVANVVIFGALFIAYKTEKK